MKVALLIGACASGLMLDASAATLIWDNNGATAPNPQDGGGTWDINGNYNWWNSTTNVQWSNSGADTAVFGNGTNMTSSAIVTLGSSTINLQRLVFAGLAVNSPYAYDLRNGTLNFGSGGTIELQDNSSFTGVTNRIQVSSSVAGNNVNVVKVSGSKLGLITFGSNSNSWTGTLTLDGSGTSAEGLFITFSTPNTISTLDMVEVKSATTAVLAGSGTHTPDWKISGTGAGNRGAIRFDQNATLTGNIILAGNASIGINPGRSVVLNGPISEETSGKKLTITAQGTTPLDGRTITLGGNNTFTGGLQIDGGLVRLNHSGALNSSGANALTFGNNNFEKTLVLNGHNVTVSGLSTAGTGANANAVIRNDSATDAVLRIQNTAANTYAGTIEDGSGGGKISVEIHNTANLTLSGANTYSGVTTISSSVSGNAVTLAHDQALGSSVGGTIMTNSNSRLRLSNNITIADEHIQATYIQNLSGNNTWTGLIQTVTTMALTLESVAGHFYVSGDVQGKSAADTNHSLNLNGNGTGEVSGAIHNLFQLNKSGSGSWILSGANTYNTATAISAGNLQVGKAGVGQTGTGAVNISGATAILSGTGLVRGSATLTNGKILAGDSLGADIGKLTFTSSLNLNPAIASTVGEFLLSNSDGDQWVIHQNFSINSNSNLSVLFDPSYILTDGDSWTLIDWDGVFTPGAGFDIYEQLSLPDLSTLGGYTGQSWVISPLQTGGALTISIVPEPSRALFALLGAIAIGLRRRRHIR